MSEVVMPRLSDSMEEGTILTWLKQVGDEVAVGDELVEIETDKANMAYESDVAGTLQEILAQEGETLPIGSPIARIGDSSNGEGPSSRPAGPVAAGDPPPAAKQQGVPPTTPPTGGAEEQDPHVQAPEEDERVKASPLARRLARDKGLELKDLHGSGPGGRIVKHDVEEAESAGGVPPAGDAVGGTPPEEALATGRGGGSPAAAGPAGQDALSLDEIQRVWPAVLHKLEETAPALAATLEGARPVSFGEEGLEVGFPAEMTFNKRKADESDRRDTVAAAFAAVTGVGLRPTYVVLDGEAPPDTPAPGSERIDEERALERLKSEFDAEEVS